MASSTETREREGSSSQNDSADTSPQETSSAEPAPPRTASPSAGLGCRGSPSSRRRRRSLSSPKYATRHSVATRTVDAQARSNIIESILSPRLIPVNLFSKETIKKLEKKQCNIGLNCGFTVAAFPKNEKERLAALHALNILDTPPEEGFDRLVEMASEISECPMSLVSLVDSERQWFKAKVGLDASETKRETSFCSHALLTPDKLFIVEDAKKDKRFVNNPLVTDAPNIRFYAGAPLVSKEGLALGTLCIIDSKPRKLTERQYRQLTTLSHQVMTELMLRDSLRRTQESHNAAYKLLESVLPPSICHRMLDNPHICNEYSSATVVFMDIVGFTQWSEHTEPMQVVSRLDLIFSEFDRICEKWNVCKIKTIGDGYMFCGGVPTEQADHAVRAMRAVFNMLQWLEVHNKTEELQPLRMRVGASSGHVIGGVFGSKRFQFDVLGRTVNLAARVEANSREGCVFVTESTRLLLQGTEFSVIHEHVATLKGIGKLQLYSVKLSNLHESW